MPVVIEGRLEDWLLEREHEAGLGAFKLTLRAAGGATWDSAAGNAFDALWRLREVVEPLGVRFCCNGARENAWSSSMQRQAAQGLVVYLLALPRNGAALPVVDTFGVASERDVVTVAEQRAWYSAWLASGRDTR